MSVTHMIQSYCTMGGTTIGSASPDRGASALATYLEFRNRITFVRLHYFGFLWRTIAMSLLHVFRLPPAAGLVALRGLGAGIRGETGRPERLLLAHDQREVRNF